MSLPVSIGHHFSPTCSMEFFLRKDFSVEAKVSVVDQLVPVRLPTEPQRTTQGYLPTAERVALLLRNRHIRPTLESGAICFTPIPPENKTWKEAHTLNLPSSKTPWVDRSNGKISYCFVNTVKTWDWKSGKEEAVSYPTMSMTCLAESPDGELVVGDDKGKVFFREATIDSGHEGTVKKISFVSKARCLVEVQEERSYSFKNLVIVDILEGSIIQRLKGASETFVREDGSILTLSAPILRLYEWNKEAGKYQAKKVIERDVWSINFLSGTKFLLKLSTLGDDYHFYDHDTGTLTELQGGIWKPVCDYSPQKALVLSEGTIAMGFKNRGTPCIQFYRDGVISHSSGAGSYGVNDLIQLSDGSVMFATDSSRAGIHVVDGKGKLGFTECSSTMCNRRVQVLKETPDGSVIAGCQDAIVIFEPIFKDPSDQASQIEVLQLKIKQNPNDLNLYVQLASLYETGSEEQFKTYVSGLICAKKAGNEYMARRFSEKAHKINPESPALAQLYPKRTGTKRNQRLFVGEGNFSFAEAFAQKHPRRKITATELLAPASEEVKERVKRLSLEGVNVLFGIDGRKLHETFAGERIERIHWNCPFKEVSGNSEEFRKVLPAFFGSCRKIQLAGDRIHVTLVQSGDEYWKTRQQENPLVLAASKAGYRLIRKRAFGPERYPGYVHTKTGKDEGYVGGPEKEFVFEKVGTPVTAKEAQTLMDPTQKSYKVKTDSEDPKETDYYYECSTDEDSSESEAS